MAWLPNAEIVAGNSAGAMNGDGSRKILLHTTEGSSIAGAIGAYRANNSWPHLTVDCHRRRVVQHLDLTVAARSLRNAPGGADQTNRDGTVHVQIELVGFATDPASVGTPADLDWLGAQVLRPIADLTGVPLASTVTWRAYPASYGRSAPQRLNPGVWDAYSGVLGHQHAPDNDHGDPGALDIARILTAATGQPTQLEEDTVQLIDFVRDPRTGSIYIVTPTEKRAIPNMTHLEHMQAHYAAKGVDVTVQAWDPADIDPIPTTGPAGDVDEADVARQVLAVLTPEAIAAAIPAEVAQGVADVLADRLAG